MSELKENCIEWITGDDRITLSLTQKRFINKVKKLKERFENEVDFKENEDGSIIAHLPLKALKLTIISTEGREYKHLFGRGEDDEQTEELLLRIREETSDDV